MINSVTQQTSIPPADPTKTPTASSTDQRVVAAAAAALSPPPSVPQPPFSFKLSDGRTRILHKEPLGRGYSARVFPVDCLPSPDGKPGRREVLYRYALPEVAQRVVRAAGRFPSSPHLMTPTSPLQGSVFCAPRYLTPSPFSLLHLVHAAIGLSSIHHAGYVHGDVKEENIMYDPCTHVAVVIDFGSVFKAERPGAPFPCMALGAQGTKKPCTPAYLPPEALASTRPARPEDTKKFDVWSLGMILYTLITGKSFYHPDSPDLNAMISRILPTLSQDAINQQIDREISEPQRNFLLKRMLTVDPTTRYSSEDVAEFLSMLAERS
jgi:hypothetical protein